MLVGLDPRVAIASGEGGGGGVGSDTPRGEQVSQAALVSVAPTIQPIPIPEGRVPKVLVIPVTDEIDLGLAPFVDRVIREHADVAAVILDINTFGGRIDAAVRIRDDLLTLKIPTVAFVNRRAISAGALIALATDQIVFAPGASMGAATPVQLEDGKAKPVEEKVVSYMRSEMRATAEAKGRRADLAEAMVDANVEIPGISPKGSLLTVTTDEALRLSLASGTSDSLESLLEALGLARAERIRPEVNWAESFARFVTSPVVAGALMSLGLLALGVELYTPGFGLTGAIGILFLGLFFGGHMVVHLAGAEEIILFLIGLALLAVEIFVTPGFGVTGVLGIVAIVTSLVMALIGLPLGHSWDTGLFAGALRHVLISLAVTAVLMMVAVKMLPRSRFGRDLVLETTVGRAPSQQLEDEDLEVIATGTIGVALTDLRPSGKARFFERSVDVVSEREYIAKGEPVRVVDASGMNVVVARTEDSGQS